MFWHIKLLYVTDSQQAELIIVDRFPIYGSIKIPYTFCCSALYSLALPSNAIIRIVKRESPPSLPELLVLQSQLAAVMMRNRSGGG